MFRGGLRGTRGSHFEPEVNDNDSILPQGSAKAVAVEDFLLQNAVVLLSSAAAGVVVFALWATLRTARFERRLALAMDRQDGQMRDLERTLSRELADTREEMLGQVSRGQREEQRAILESGGRIFQGME